MKIIMASDLVSPYCWIATHQVEKAMAQFANITFEVELWPFQVTPGLPQDYTFSRYKQEQLVTNFGSIAQVEGVLSRVQQLGASNDCEFRFDRVEAWPNTRLAHALWMLGDSSEQQWQLHKALCKAHFNQGINLNLLENLIQLGEAHGLKASTIEEKLTDSQYLTDVMKKIIHTRDQRINSVPTIIIDNRYSISGAKGHEALIGTIEACLESQMLAKSGTNGISRS